MRTLLPEDAVQAGTWGFGTLQSAPKDADERVSGQLAARYRLLGEPRTGAVLVLYTYDGDACNPGSVIRIGIRPAVIPSQAPSGPGSAREAPGPTSIAARSAARRDGDGERCAGHLPQ